MKKKCVVQNESFHFQKHWGAFNTYVDKMRGSGVGGMGSKIGYFCPRADQGIKTILAGGTLMFYGFCVPLSDFRSIFNFCQTKQTG